jgi:phenylalanyl-tRNA synthetase beta chain
MNISLNWLRDYVQVDERPSELADKMTMAGLAVDAIHQKSEIYKKFVIAVVNIVQAHPSADRLSVCGISDGKRRYSIVCGAPNVAPGQKVVLAKTGAVVPANGMEVKSVEIRGEQSEGMICSERELGLGEDHEGILVLPKSAKTGASFSSYYWQDDVVFEVDITPNRPDCLSHIGVAREIAAIYRIPYRIPRRKIKEADKTSRSAISISIDDLDHCPRYVGRVLENVVIGTAPDWMRRRLEAVGVRSINAVVDVTNYVMLEYGQPLHAFDYDLLRDRKIIVRRARDGETFITLDGRERVLQSNNLLICDGKRAVALGGVMGGLNSEIHENTKSVLIESAYFAPSSVRRTAKQLGLVTESSFRFERGVNAEGTAVAADRAVQLIQEVTGATVLKGRVDVYPNKIRKRSVSFRPSQVRRVLGVDIRSGELRNILKALDIKIERVSRSGAWRCVIPGFRPDLEREIDLVEEVARIYGYDNIPANEWAHIRFNTGTEEKDIDMYLREWFIGSGFREVLCNSMVPSVWSTFTNLSPVAVLNPQNRDMTVLRTSLIPGMLQVVKHNQNHGNYDLRIYEIGHIFATNPFPGSRNYVEQYHEAKRVALVLSGVHNREDWLLKDRKSDFYDIKGEVEALINKFNLDKVDYNIYHSTSNTLIEEGISIDYQGVSSGIAGKVYRELLQSFDIASDVFIAELDVSLFTAALSKKRKYSVINKYPPAYRDLAFVLDDGIPYSELEALIRSSGGPLLSGIRFFDMYRGEKIGVGKKSIAVSIELISPERTLTSEGVEETIDRIIRAVREKLGASLRS